jgi:phosphate transport system substrate-binding protein
MAQAANAALAREGMLIATTDTESADALERIPGAVGTAALSTLVSERRALKAVTINGHEASTKALAAGRYPWHKTIYLITHENTPPAVANFIRFAGTPAARAILSDNGNVPAANK